MRILVTSASGANGNGYGALLGFGPQGEFWDHSATIRESPIHAVYLLTRRARSSI
jgi:hypothetical protein